MDLNTVVKREGDVHVYVGMSMYMCVYKRILNCCPVNGNIYHLMPFAYQAIEVKLCEGLMYQWEMFLVFKTSAFGES